MDEELEPKGKLESAMFLIWTLRYFRKHRKECLACANENPEVARPYRCMVRLMASYGRLLLVMVISFVVTIITAP